MNIFHAVIKIANYSYSTRLLAASTPRTVLGTRGLVEILSERETISRTMQTALDEATDPWGVKVERVEIKDVRLPVQLQRAMATEAEAAREVRAKVIAAEGEMRASHSLKEASNVISTSPPTLQVRYPQTLNNICGEKNSTVIFPLPVEFLTPLLIPSMRGHQETVQMAELLHKAEDKLLKIMILSFITNVKHKIIIFVA
ncbi:band 7 protein AGAP004871-like [Formica exsecta]|uniref:band 7 protein AGAP004871-like n=1 Tax=Formica exsecta TaxID=72781 RepID=UPI0011430850|nr:band 7 protein AGAP004871-like [Formica exsecta]